MHAVPLATCGYHLPPPAVYRCRRLTSQAAEDYVEATRLLVEQEGIRDPVVFVTTEDRQALLVPCRATAVQWWWRCQRADLTATGGEGHVQHGAARCLAARCSDGQQSRAAHVRQRCARPWPARCTPAGVQAAGPCNVARPDLRAGHHARLFLRQELVGGEPGSERAQEPRRGLYRRLADAGGAAEIAVPLCMAGVAAGRGGELRCSAFHSGAFRSVAGSRSGHSLSSNAYPHPSARPSSRPRNRLGGTRWWRCC